MKILFKIFIGIKDGIIQAGRDILWLVFILLLFLSVYGAGFSQNMKDMKNNCYTYGGSQDYNGTNYTCHQRSEVMMS